MASLIEEVDFAGAVEEQLWQIARRVTREDFSPPMRALVDEVLDHVDRALVALREGRAAGLAHPEARDALLLELRARCLRLNGTVRPAERGALLALLGTAERALLLMARLEAERRSVSRSLPAPVAAVPREGFGGAAVQPAE